MSSQIPQSYGRVLRRTDRDVCLAANMRYSSYDCSLPALAVEHPDGIKALTLFFPEGKNAAAHRATRLGWVDVTASWRVSPLQIAEVIEERVEVAPSAVADRSSKKPTEEGLAKMTWSGIRALAKERGTSVRGSRANVESALLASFEG
tara:strand:- start:301 stop:744 length:444 start_codon:yes stop_codon:yes gene_type:complete